MTTETERDPFFETLEEPVPLASASDERSGKVWLRGRLTAELMEGRREDRSIGVRGLPEIKGDVGLASPADKDGIVSREVVLWE